MKFFLEDFVSAQDKDLFGQIKDVAISLPDIYLGRDYHGKKIIISCHMMARAFGRVFCLKVVDGFFSGPFCHSWLLTSNGKFIIDVYPVLMLGGPILVSNKDAWDLGARLYKPAHHSKIVKAMAFSSPEFRRSVYRLEKAVEQSLKDCNKQLR